MYDLTLMIVWMNGMAGCDGGSWRCWMNQWMNQSMVGCLELRLHSLKPSHGTYGDFEHLRWLYGWID